MRYRFGSHVLDLDAVELRTDDGPVEVEPRTFAVLAYLLTNRHRVVTKEELLDEIWGDRFVGESALSTRIKHARRAVGDDGRAQQVIRTVHGTGYQFVADVDAGVETPAASGWAARRSRRPLGRDEELDDLRRRLRTHRLVTVTGPGGVGKSTLCVELLERPDDDADRPGERRLCELADVRAPHALPSAVLAAVGEGQQSDADPLESLLRCLERREVLLVLDNCEHLAEDVAALCRALLARAPHVRVVTTSRVPLGVEGESELRLAPLPPADAAECFAARAADAGATVDAADPAVTDLCHRLDHLPLALELAAARSRLLSPLEMCELLDDRFRLLRSSALDDARHRSLHRTIEWSWELLAPADQDLLATLSVLVGSFAVDDVAGVTCHDGDAFDVVDALERLVAASLVSTVPGPSGRTRFRLLDSVRDFAAQQLRDPTAARRWHATYFARRVEELDALCQTTAIDEGLAGISLAWDNLRTAVTTSAATGDTETVTRIIRAVGDYADLFQTFEVLQWCELLPDPPADVRAVEARLRAHRGEHERARTLAEDAHRRHRCHATTLAVVWCAYYAGDLDRVLAEAESLTTLSRSTRGLEHGFAEGFRAIVAAVRQVPELHATTVAPEHAARGALGVLDCLAAGFRLCTVDPERAAELLEAVVVESLRRDYRLLLGAAASTLTQLTLPGRPAAEAVRTLQRTLRLYLERGMWVLISADTVMAAKLLADAGDRDTAACLLGARRASGYRAGLSEVLREMLTAQLTEEMGDRFEQLAAQGATWRPPEAAEAALAALERCLAPTS